MDLNPVQIQKGLSLNEFLSLYGTDQRYFDLPDIIPRIVDAALRTPPTPGRLLNVRLS